MSRWRQLVRGLRVLDRFDATAPPSVRDRFEAFCLAESAWLDDFALYMAVKAAHDHQTWTAWPPDIAQRDAAACARWLSVSASSRAFKLL